MYYKKAYIFISNTSVEVVKSENFKIFVISIQSPVAIWIPIEFANWTNSIQFKMSSATSIRDSISIANLMQQLAEFFANYEVKHYFSFLEVS